MTQRSTQTIERAWAETAGVVATKLDVDPSAGLAESEVRERLNRYGMNRLRRTRRRSALGILVEQFKSPMVVLLAAAAVLAVVFVDWLEGGAIAAVIVINAAIGFVTELRAVRSMESLYRLEQLTARVRRGGHVAEVPAQTLVPGDVVLIEAGDLITADLRLVESSKLQASESTLTGESVPVDKAADAVPADVPLAERHCMLYKGTAATRGSAVTIVVATGMATELGRITSLIAEADSAATPLERRLERLTRRMIWLTLGLASAVIAAGIATGRELILMVETGVALAVAAVPEGLPVVATIALARGMWRMAQHNALINRLSAVETLGATGVICTDKTGTLTENRMTVTRVVLPSGTVVVEDTSQPHAFTSDGEPRDPKRDAPLGELLEIAVLCNGAELDGDRPLDGDGAVGDPMEVALLIAGAKAALSRPGLIESQARRRTESFDSATKMMATFHEREGGAIRVAVKGAPEAVIDACSRMRTEQGEQQFGAAEREAWRKRAQGLAGDGLRLLALATKRVDSVDVEPYADLVFLGLVGLLDPPRADVREAIERCRAAGIRVVMVTGDHPDTARHVAREVGLIEDDAADEVLSGSELELGEETSEADRTRLLAARIFARVSPEQKLNLIDLYQSTGAIVAMTGDGVNDAPALKRADIGVAMGRRGTQVARDAADMVLKDDAFRTIVLAVAEGRVIFDNIRKFVLYLLSCNMSEVLVVTFAMLVHAPMPLLPLQILFLNLVTDIFPALALGVGPGDPRIMDRKPRDPHEAILSRPAWIRIGIHGATITASVLGAFATALVWLELNEAEATTISFLTLALAQLWHVFNMRDRDSSLWWNDVVRNGYVWGALIICLLLLASAVYAPFLARVLDLVEPDARGWGVIAVFSIIPWVLGQLYLRIEAVGARVRNERISSASTSETLRARARDGDSEATG